MTVINIDDEVARNIHARPESPASKHDHVIIM